MERSGMHEEVVFWCMDRERNEDQDTGMVLCVGRTARNMIRGGVSWSGLWIPVLSDRVMLMENI
jgi:hypothetical protein